MTKQNNSRVKRVLLLVLIFVLGAVLSVTPVWYAGVAVLIAGSIILVGMVLSLFSNLEI
jgi:ABC-type protease/lipase transport system fused ATPase/permease subunit